MQKLAETITSMEITEVQKTLSNVEEWIPQPVSQTIDTLSIASANASIVVESLSPSYLITSPWVKSLTFHAVSILIFEMCKMSDSRARCYPYDSWERYIFLVPAIYIGLVFLSLLLINKTCIPSWTTFKHLYGISDSAIEFYGAALPKCAAVLFSWMVYVAGIYLILGLAIPCETAHDRENWGAVRWGLFYSTHFWYASTILFWAFATVTIHTYPKSVYEELLNARRVIEAQTSRHAGFFQRVLRTLEDHSETEGSLYVVLFGSVVVILLSLIVSVGTQILETEGATGYIVWSAFNLFITALPVLYVVMWMAWSVNNQMTSCMKALMLFESRVDWKHLGDILFFENMRDHVVQKEIPYRLSYPLYHTSWFCSFSVVLMIVYVIMLIQNWSGFANDPRFVAVKLARNIISLLILMFSMLFFRRFAELHAGHDGNHRKLLQKSIVDTQIKKMRFDAEISELSLQIREAQEKSDTENEAAMTKKVQYLKDDSDELERILQVLEKMHQFQEGLDPLYAVRIFGIQVRATPALVDAVYGSIGAYIAVVFSLFINQLTA